MHRVISLALLSLAVAACGGSPDPEPAAVQEAPMPGAGAIAYVDANNGTRSWGTGGMAHSGSIDGVCGIWFEAEQINPLPRFRITAQISEKRRPK